MSFELLLLYLFCALGCFAFGLIGYLGWPKDALHRVLMGVLITPTVMVMLAAVSLIQSTVAYNLSNQQNAYSSALYVSLLAVASNYIGIRLRTRQRGS